MSAIARWGGLVAWLVVTGAAAAVGGLGSTSAPGLYAALERPGWAPPAEWFGPVWSVLYVTMAIAAWIVWCEPRPARAALALFALQLALNAAWSWLFFAWRQGELALAGIGLLWVAIVATAAEFARVRRLAALLLVPYLAWVTYAAALTAVLLRLNPGRL